MPDNTQLQITQPDNDKDKELKELISKNHNGENWTKSNVITIITWLQTAMYQIEVLEESIQYYRRIVKYNIILGLLLSTSSGTISATNIMNSSLSVSFIINILFTTMSFIIAISTGFIKVYQVQENLEEFIKVKQEWTIFTTGLLTEVQMPLKIRYNAFLLIMSHKEKYSELLKYNLNIPEHILNKGSGNSCYEIVVRNCFKENQNNTDVITTLKRTRDLKTIINNTIYKLNIEYKFLGKNNNANSDEINDMLNNAMNLVYNIKDVSTVYTQIQTDISNNIPNYALSNLGTHLANWMSRNPQSSASQNDRGSKDTPFVINVNNRETMLNEFTRLVTPEEIERLHKDQEREKQKKIILASVKDYTKVIFSIHKRSPTEEEIVKHIKDEHNDYDEAFITEIINA